MAYEVKLSGKVVGTYGTEEEAMAAVREAILADADSEPEVYDTDTGKPAAPGSSAGWREHLANKTGF